MSEVAVRETVSQLVLSSDQLRFIAGTEFVPKAMRGNLPAIMACVATGRSLGISDMHALRSIHIIDGKASMSAELMVALARRAGHSISADIGPDSCTVKGRRGDNGDEMSCTWTLEMAEKAGLLNKDNWKKYPQAMLWARPASQLCRMLFPDVLAGVSLTPEEAEMSQEERVAEVLRTAIPADTGPEEEMRQLPAAEADEDEPEQVEVEVEPEVEPGEQASFFEEKAAEAQARAQERGE